MACVETIAERFGLTVLDDACKLNALAGAMADDDAYLLDCICVLEEMEGNAARVREVLEGERSRREPARQAKPHV